MLAPTTTTLQLAKGSRVEGGSLTFGAMVSGAATDGTVTFTDGLAASQLTGSIAPMAVSTESSVLLRPERRRDLRWARASRPATSRSWRASRESTSRRRQARQRWRALRLRSTVARRSAAAGRWAWCDWLRVAWLGKIFLAHTSG
ncbi:MAG: hypothetical protein K0S37_3844 [Microbacterium sp.]|nr:hypothetical protein [Microbacterium sp.]